MSWMSIHSLIKKGIVKLLNKYSKSVLTALAVTICFACHSDQEIQGAEKVPLH